MGQKSHRELWTGWQADLETSRDLRRRQQEGIAFVLRWFLKWVEMRGLLGHKDVKTTEGHTHVAQG